MINIIKDFEGFSGNAYLCPAGVWTIGYGHTGGVKPSDHVTPERATELLMEDLCRAEKAVNRLRVDLRQCQFDALVSLVHNIGTGAFAQSTIRRLVEADPGDPAIPAQFGRWVKSDGNVLRGLVTRRERESRVYLGQYT